MSNINCEFILLEAFWHSLTCRLMFFVKFGVFIFSLWNFHYTYGGMLNGVPNVKKVLFIFHFFFTLPSLDCVNSTDVASLFCQFKSVVALPPLMNFSFQLLYFLISTLNFLFGLIYNLYFFDIPYLWSIIIHVYFIIYTSLIWIWHTSLLVCSSVIFGQKVFILDNIL